MFEYIEALFNNCKTAFVSVVELVNDLSIKTSNWIVFNDGFYPDAQILIHLGIHLLRENAVARALRRLFGDAEERNFLRFPFSLIENLETVIQVHAGIRVIVNFAYWTALAQLSIFIAGMVYAPSIPMVTILSLGFASAGLLASYYTLTYFGFQPQAMPAVPERPMPPVRPAQHPVPHIRPARPALGNDEPFHLPRENPRVYLNRHQPGPRIEDTDTESNDSDSENSDTSSEQSSEASSDLLDYRAIPLRRKR